MKVWNWENEFMAFSRNFGDYDLSKVLTQKVELDAAYGYLNKMLKNKFEGQVFVCNKAGDDTDNHWYYNGVTIKNDKCMHQIINRSTNEVREFGLSDAGYTLDVKASNFNINYINKVTKDIIQDLKYKAFIKATGKTRAYEDFAYPRFWDMIEYFKGRLDEIFEYWSDTIADFMQAKLVFPDPVEEVINNVMFKYYIPALKNEKVADSIDELADSELDTELIKWLLKETSSLHYVKLAKAYIKDKLDEGNLSKDSISKINFMATQAKKLIEVSKNITMTKLQSIIHNKTTYIAKYNDRLATKKELDKMYASLTIEKIQLIAPEIASKLVCLYWCLEGNDKYYVQINCVKGDKELGYTLCTYDSNMVKVANVTRKLYYTLQWFNPETLQIIYEEVKANANIEYLDYAEDEITEDDTIEDMVKELYVYDGDSKKTVIYQNALNIISNMKISNIHKRLDSARMVYEAYHMIKENSSQEFNTPLEKATYLNKNIMKVRDKVSRKYTFHIQVVQSVAKYGKASPKQAVYIDELFEAWRKYDKSLAMQTNSLANGVVIEDDQPEEQSVDINTLSMYNILGSGALND